MKDNMQISPINRTAIPLEGRYTVELFDKDGNLANSQEVKNTIMYEMPDSFLNFYKFACEYGTSIDSAISNKPSVMNGSLYTGPYNALGLYTQKPSKDHKRFLPAIPVGASYMGNAAPAADTFQGSHNTAQSSYSFADGHMIIKDVFEFSTSQANGTINSLGMFKVYSRREWLDRTQHVPYSRGTGGFKPYLTYYGVPRQSATGTNNTLFNAKKNVHGRAVDIPKKLVLSGVEAYMAGLAKISSREATTKDLIFPGMLLEDESVAIQVCGSQRTMTTSNPILKYRKITVATGATEEGSIVLWDILPKLKKYLGTSATDTSTAYIDDTGILFQVRGLVGIRIALSARTAVYPRLYEDGSMTPTALQATVAYGLYDFNTNSWLIEPDLENINAAYYSPVGSTSSKVPAWAANVSSSNTDTWNLNNDLYKWCTGEVAFERYGNDVIFVVNPFGDQYTHLKAPTLGYSARATTFGQSTNGAIGYIHDPDLGYQMVGAYCVGTAIQAYKSLVHLDSPVVKTSEYTMKVTYTISIKIPNMFGKPGHEYEFDLDEA